MLRVAIPDIGNAKAWLYGDSEAIALPGTSANPGFTIPKNNPVEVAIATPICLCLTHPTLERPTKTLLLYLLQKKITAKKDYCKKRLLQKKTKEKKKKSQKAD